ncbi:hypothetical protein AB0M05_43805 [Streptomyces violaceusniger]|uniref:hypothetical protein n=1 Tax=Streptomyces violaceusniger TaxID=68280 RepID=UPI003414BE20
MAVSIRETGAREIAFVPALPGSEKVEPGIGYLQPGGLVAASTRSPVTGVKPTS